MKGFSNKKDDLDKKNKSIIDQNEVNNLIKKYKKLKKFRKSNLHTINELYGRSDIIQELVNEYMESYFD